MKFKVSEKIFKKYPDIVEYIVVGTGLNSEVPSKKINDRLDEIAVSLKGKREALKDPKCQKWLEIYENISKNAVPSHVSLLKRAIRGKKIPHISPIVNLCNYYSLKHKVSIGAEDLDKIYGDLELKYATGEELFLEIGGKKVEKVGKGEVVWVDGHSVTCRNWGWKQNERTKITKASKNIFFTFDTLSEFDFEKVVGEFASEIKKTFGSEVKVLKIFDTKKTVDSGYKTKIWENINDTNTDLEQLIRTSEIEKNEGKKFLLRRKAKSLELVDPSCLTQKLSKILDSQLSKVGVSEKSQLEFSKNLEMGDFYSTVVLREAGKKGVSAAKIGENIVEKLKNSDLVGNPFKDIQLAPNMFINFTLSESYLDSQLSKSVGLKDKFGDSDIGNKRVIVVESPSINPNAPAHVGHLRNLLIGRSLARLLEKVGFQVEKDNLINDKDNKVCMAMWGYLKKGGSKTPESEKMKGDHFVGRYYVIGRNAYNSDPKAKKEIIEMLKKLESGDENITKLWMKVTKWAFTGQLQTFEKFNEERGFLWFESELWKGGKELVERYLGKGVVEELPNGALIGRIQEDYGVPDVVLLRADGTTVYHTQDINLTIKRIEKFNPWKVVWVVGNEHILHFQRLFALLDKLKIVSVDNLYAYVYGMVLGKDGRKISSRSGGEASADLLLDMACEAAKKVLSDRKVDEKIKSEIAEKVGQGALRFDILSKDAYKDIILDIEKATSFTGKSGTYVMYAYTRASSILEKVGKVEGGAGDVEILPVERELLLKLFSYPEVVLIAANNYLPNVIADYAYEVAALFSNFYEKCPVVKSKGGALAFRKALTELSASVLKSALGILGIEVIEKM